MDYVALGFVRPSTKAYVANCQTLTDLTTQEVAPVIPPKWGESWDDERYKSELGNVKSIGPYFEWFYASRS